MNQDEVEIKKDTGGIREDASKRSIVAGGLTGTLGLFLAKMVGLLYSIPLSRIFGSDMLTSIYGSAYRIYSYTLNIFTAGIPFAISTLVAKYTVKGDARTLVKVKQISVTFLQITGFLGMVLLIAISGMIAPLLVADSEYVGMMKLTLRILSLAIFLVPILSAYRGFWQGRKEMREYAFSQTFEQLVRVGFLLSMAFLVVYVFHMDRVVALYMAVLSTSVAAFAGIVQIIWFDRRAFAPISSAAKEQQYKGVKKKDLFKELLILAVPYLLTAMIGYVDDIFNSMLLPISLKLHGYNSADTSVILNAVNYVGAKMTSIPQVLSPGFAAALIPHITEARTDNDNERVSRIVSECVSIVVFVGAFMSAILAIYATDTYHTLFYTSNIELAASVERWMAIEGFMGTISPVTSSIMIALGMKKDVLRNLIISAVIKGAAMVPMIYLLGYRGAVVSSIMGNIFVFGGNLVLIARKYRLDAGLFAKSALKIVICLLAATAVSFGLRWLGIAGDEGTRLLAFAKLIVNGIITVIVYFGVSEILHVSQDLFHRSLFAVVKARIKK